MIKKFTRANWTVLLLFGLVGQIAWSVENMYFNLFVFETVAPDLDSVTLMVQLSGIVATLATLVGGTLSDKSGNRRRFIAYGYAIWGVTVAVFGFLSPELIEKMLGLEGSRAITVTLVLVIVGDCVMTLFGSTANDAGFNAWVTDNTEKEYRGSVEGIISILPLLSMLIVAGGFGMLVEAIGYSMLFLLLGAVISGCGIVGIFIIKDSPTLEKNGSLRDLLYGFRPSTIKAHLPLYLTLCIVLIYGISTQIFMPYMIIYMKTYLDFSTVEYSIVFGAAILFGAAINVYLTRLSDRLDKNKLLYIAAAIMAAGLLGMYFSRYGTKIVKLITFGGFGFVMITGFIFVSALCGSTVRDLTPEGEVGKLQGVRMVFSVLVPMIVGPMIGNAINRAMNIPLPDLGSADTMTTKFIPAPEIYLAAAIAMLAVFAVIPVITRKLNNNK